MLSIRLLGPPEIRRDKRRLDINRRKSRALVYYLAAHAEPLPRERLLAFFWADAERASAQQTLRAILYNLRQTLGEALVAADDKVGLTAEVEVDVRQFESRLQTPGINSAITRPLLAPGPAELEALNSALGLYRGEFLADFSLPDTPEFDDWVVAERERYRRLMMRGLTALSRWHEATQNYAQALDALNRALDIDPLQEDMQRAALRLHYFAGDRTGAIRRYDQFRQLLADEMGVPPMTETQALYDAIITDQLPVPAPAPQPAAAPEPSRPRPAPDHRLPFTGRTLELGALRQLKASHKVALIEGEAGIGKTRLAEEFIATSDALPLSGRARELESSIPYQPVVEALRDFTSRPAWRTLRTQLNLLPVWLDEVARLLPELSDSHTRATIISAPVTINDESRLWEGMFQFLLALARRQSLIFVLDDAHWADVSSLALMGYLARRTAATDAPITLMMTTRTIELRSPLATMRQTLLREGRLEHLRLQALSAEDTAQLAQYLSAQYAQPLADWLSRLSEGNPYILSELVRTAREQNILLANGVMNLDALTEPPPVPQSVYSLIQSRLLRLSSAARRVMDVGVAAGREFEYDIVARAAGLSEAAVLDALDELREAYFIGEGRDAATGRLSYTFAHTLMMEVAYREIGEARHRLLHRRVAEAMEQVYHAQLDEAAGLLAWHYIEGLAPEKAAPYAFRAGQQAARLPAWKEAVSFYEQALRGERNAETRREIFIALGDAHYQSGAITQAIEAFRQVLALTRDVESADDVRLRLARSLMIAGRYAETIALAQEIIAAGNPRSQAEAEFTWGAALSIEGADLEGAMEHLQQAALLARDDPVKRAQMGFEMGSVEAQLGNLERAIALYHEALRAAQQAGAADEAIIRQILANNNLAYHLHLLGDPTAVQYAEEGLRLAQEKGHLTLTMYLLSTLGEIALAAGDDHAAEARFEEGLALAEQFVMPERIAGLTANLGRVALARGQTALAIHRLSTALTRAETLGIQHLAAQIQLWLAPLLPPAEARMHLAGARAIAESGRRKRLLAEVERLEKSLDLRA